MFWIWFALVGDAGGGGTLPANEPASAAPEATRTDEVDDRGDGERDQGTGPWAGPAGEGR